jgi:hypothetical protein
MVWQRAISKVPPLSSSEIMETRMIPTIWRMCFAATGSEKDGTVTNPNAVFRVNGL